MKRRKLNRYDVRWTDADHGTTYLNANAAGMTSRSVDPELASVGAAWSILESLRDTRPRYVARLPGSGARRSEPVKVSDLSAVVSVRYWPGR